MRKTEDMNRQINDELKIFENVYLETLDKHQLLNLQKRLYMYKYNELTEQQRDKVTDYLNQIKYLLLS